MNSPSSSNPNKNVHPQNRAVSDTLAFVLTFAIIVASVGVVYGVGFGSLKDIRDGQQGVDAGRTFKAFGEDLNDIRDGGVDSKSARLALRDGTLAVDTTSRITVTINGSEDYVDDRQLGTLIYRVDEKTTMGYEGGASFGKYGTDSVMNVAPNFKCGSGTAGNTTVISIVVVEQESSSMGSTGTVGITAKKRNETLHFPTQIMAGQDVDNVSVTITDSPFQDAWNSEFDSRSGWSRSGNTYTCDTDQVFVRVTVIGISFET